MLYVKGKNRNWGEDEDGGTGAQCAVDSKAKGVARAAAPTHPHFTANPCANCSYSRKQSLRSAFFYEPCVCWLGLP